MFTWLVAIFIGGPILIGIFVGASHEPPAPKSVTPEAAAAQKKQDAAVQRAVAGAVMLKKAMRDPESFKLESALVIDGSGAVCYGYRAKNGFGGVNAGHAVLSSDGKKFKTDEMDGFIALWNKVCADKRGTETATAINWFAL
ncbi:MAG: hypothetical protein ACT4P0_12825 [Panacagrimonas sp.]